MADNNERGPAPNFTGEWRELPLAVIDFETTGLDPKKDRIVEYGVALFREGEYELSIGELLDPEVGLSEAVQKVHGLTDEDLKGKPTFRDVMPNLISLLSGRIPVAYNAPFDRRFLHAELDRLEINYLKTPAFVPFVEWIDPLVWIRKAFKYAKGKKLTDMAPRLGVTLDNAHRATADAKATGEVLFKLSPPPKQYADLIAHQMILAEAQEADYQRWKARQG